MQFDNVMYVCSVYSWAVHKFFSAMLVMFYLTLGCISAWLIKIDTAVHFSLNPIYIYEIANLFSNADQHHVNIIDYIYLKHI